MSFNEHLQPDVEAVLDAAAILDITEYDLFDLAYDRWHGERAEEAVLERFFVAYMFNDVVPIWVRHFARLVQRLNSRGELDRRALGVRHNASTPEGVNRGLRFGVALVLIMGTLFVLAQTAAELMNLASRCSFPPCY